MANTGGAAIRVAPTPAETAGISSEFYSGRNGNRRPDVQGREGSLRNSVVGRGSDADSGDSSTAGKCRLEYEIGLTSSSVTGTCHTLQWNSKITRKLVWGGLVGEVYALCKMVDHWTFTCRWSAWRLGYGAWGTTRACARTLRPIRRKSYFLGRSVPIYTAR